MSEFSIPNFKRSRLDLKELKTRNFYFAVQSFMDNNMLASDTEVIIFTNFGTITGFPFFNFNIDENNDEDLSKFIKTFMSTIEDSDNEIISSYESNIPNANFINNVSSIILKNVVIVPYSSTDGVIELPFFNLFTDQIIGISIGNLE